MNNMKILAIDTSCDETSAAVTFNDKVITNIVWSQIEIHKTWGGVVPRLAKRAHQQKINQAINDAVKRTRTNLSQIDYFAVTQGPGLAPSLEIGIKKAKELALKFKRPLIAINHMEGHLLSSFAKNSKGNNSFKSNKITFPILGLLISGGHTQLVLMKNFGQYKLLGETLDDAAGEAFDKVAKMLNLGYPGGPIIEKLAKEGNPHRFDFPLPMSHHPGLNFSFSGLKTACLYKLKKIPEKEKTRKFLADFSASFQLALTKSITIKLTRALKHYQPKSLILGGGVISNLFIRNNIRKTAKEFSIPVLLPYNKKLLTDNAAMIGVAAYYKAKRKEFVRNIKKIDRLPNLNFKAL